MKNECRLLLKYKWLGVCADIQRCLLLVFIHQRSFICYIQP